MKNYVMGLFLCAVMLAFGGQGALAQGEAATTYMMRGLSVSLPQGDPVKSRDEAIKKITRSGLAKLLENLTTRENWGHIPSIIEDANWDTIVTKFSIVDEQISPRYKLVMDVAYSRQDIRQLLTTRGISYSEVKGGRVLLVPLFEEGSRMWLWENENAWRHAVDGQLSAGGFFEMIIPTEIAHESPLTPEMAAFGAGDVLTQLATKYNADAAIVMKARLDGAVGSAVDVSLSWYGDDTVAPTTLRVYPQMGEELSATLQRAARQSLSAFEDNWRQSEMVRVDRSGRLFLRFKPYGPADLERLKDKVSGIASVKEFKLRVLNRNDSVYQVDFFGDSQQLHSQLVKLGLHVEPTSMNMVWKVAFDAPAEASTQ